VAGAAEGGVRIDVAGGHPGPAPSRSKGGFGARKEAGGWDPAEGGGHKAGGFKKGKPNRPVESKGYGDEPRAFGEKSFGGEKAFGEKKPYGAKAAKPSFSDEPRPAKAFGEKAFGGEKGFGEKPFAEKKPYGEKKPYAAKSAKPYGDEMRPARSGGFAAKPYAEKASKPFADKPFGDKPFKGKKADGPKSFGPKTGARAKPNDGPARRPTKRAAD
jgi:hypothetical protein